MQNEPNSEALVDTCIQAITALLTNGADVFAQDKDGNTAIHLMFQNMDS